MELREKEVEQLKEDFPEDWEEIIENMMEDEVNFTVAGYRFIHTDNIDDILIEELSDDADVLGSFSAEMIREVTCWPLEVIKTTQEAGKHAVIGQAIIDENLVEEIAMEYSRSDGYGAHFGTENGDEEEIGDYYVFKVS